MPHFTLTLFGLFAATLNGAPVRVFKSNKVRALLAYLAVGADRPHPREVLAGLLWPEMPDAAALGNLRNALSNLRRLFDCVPGLAATNPPPFLLTTRETVQFDPNSNYWLDVAAFRRDLLNAKILASRHNPGDQLGVIESLVSAVRLHSGPFLHGFSVDSAPFQEWTLLKREEYQRLCMEALGTLADFYERHCEFQKAQTYVRRQLEMEPWQEEAHRQLMRLLAESNQRSAALSQYAVCRRVLTAEVGVEPGDETRRLYEAICSGDLVAAVPVTVDPGALHTYPDRRPPLTPFRPVSDLSGPFVGREHELLRLHKFLDAAMFGHGQVVFVVGESGSGKTTLLAEFEREALAAHPELVAARSACQALVGFDAPYLPFREILQRLIESYDRKWTEDYAASADGDSQHAGGPTALETAGSPGFDPCPPPWPATVFVTDAPIAAAHPGISRHSAMAEGLAAATGRGAIVEVQHHATGPSTTLEQIIDVFQAYARQDLLLLLIDDLQWADPGTLSLLFHLSRRLAGQPILVVGAYRPSDIAADPSGERHPLELLVHEVQRIFGDICIDLDKADGQSFVEAYLRALPSQLDSTFRENLYQHTEGHPLFTIELMRGFEERGDVVREGGLTWVEGSSLDWDRLPARAEAVIAERIDRLSPEWQALLEIASVEGRVFTAEVLAQVSNHPLNEILWRLGTVLSKEHRLVRAHDLQRLWLEGEDREVRLSRYCFTHWMIQKYLYNRLDEVARACIHEGVAVTLEALFGSRASEIAGQLAWHYERAGRPARSATYRLLMAGKISCP